MLGEQRERFVSEVARLKTAINENRHNLSAARHLLRQDARRPGLWIDAGKRGLRAYSQVRIGVLLLSGLLRVTRLKFVLGGAMRILPLAGVGWGAYRLMRR